MAANPPYSDYPLIQPNRGVSMLAQEAAPLHPQKGGTTFANPCFQCFPLYPQRPRPCYNFPMCLHTPYHSLWFKD